MDYIYNANFENDPDGGYLVTFPDVPEAITGGKDMREAMLNASDGLAAALSGYFADGRDLPAAEYKDGTPISLGAPDTAKFAVIQAFKESGLTKAELARRLNKDEKEVRRILNPDQMTKMQTLEEALRVLGMRIFITIRSDAHRFAA